MHACKHEFDRQIMIIEHLWNALFSAVLLVRADDHEFRLIRDIMVRYDKRTRPSGNHTLPTTVNFSVALAQIIDVVWLFM